MNNHTGVFKFNNDNLSFFGRATVRRGKWSFWVGYLSMCNNCDASKQNKWNHNYPGGAIEVNISRGLN